MSLFWCFALWFSPACLWWGCAFWPWWLLPCCKKRAAPFTMKKLSLRLQNRGETISTKTQMLYMRHGAAEQQLSTVVSPCSVDSEAAKWNAIQIFSFTRTVLFSSELPEELSRKVQLLCYSGRLQGCNSSESSLDAECLSRFFSAAWTTLTFDLSGVCWLGVIQHRPE